VCVCAWLTRWVYACVCMCVCGRVYACVPCVVCVFVREDGVLWRCVCARVGGRVGVVMGVLKFNSARCDSMQ